MLQIAVRMAEDLGTDVMTTLRTEPSHDGTQQRVGWCEWPSWCFLSRGKPGSWEQCRLCCMTVVVDNRSPDRGLGWGRAGHETDHPPHTHTHQLAILFALPGVHQAVRGGHRCPHPQWTDV